MQPASPEAAPADPRLACYLANLSAFYATDPELAARVDQLPFSAMPVLQATRDGQWTTQVMADDDKAITVHSRYQPVEEARALVEAQARRPLDAGAEVPDADDDLENQCFLISGLGLGYHVAEIERRFPRPFLIVAEDDLALLKAALCVTDLAVPLRERRLAFLATTDKSQVHERLRPILTLLMLGLRFIAPPHARRYHARFHAQVSALMRDFVAYGRLQMVSVVRNARITCQNAAFNVAAYVSRPGVEVLTGRAAGYPAILVAAGPSLARNIDQLPGLRDRAVIVAVQTVFRTLQARGCPPHFVTSLDYHEISAQFFQGIDDFGDTILVAEPKVSWHVLDTFRGRTHVLNSGFLNDLLRDAAPTRGKLRAGSTVAHLAFYLAEHLGCDPIILVGQDLAFPEGLYYPPGMQIERIWQPELGRFVTVEMKQWERVVRSRSSLRRVKDIHGRDTYTDDQMYTYAEQFESDFLASRAHVIHATEGGRQLEGTQVMMLREAAERFCTRPLPPDLFAVGELPPPADLNERVQAELDRRLTELREIRQIAVDTLTTLDRLVELVERPAKFNRLVGRVDELRARMQRNDRTYGLVSQVSQLAELRRVHADRAIRDEQTETPARARRRLTRDREYVAAFTEGCDYMLRMLPEAVERVRERLA